MQTTWWRWPLVPVAALAAFFGATLFMVAVTWLQVKFIGGASDGWLYRYIAPLYVGAVGGWAFSWAAKETAPNGKVIACTVMVTLFSLLMLLGTLMSWSQSTTAEAVRTTLASVAAVAGAIAAAASA